MALHPLSVEEGDRVTLILGRAWLPLRAAKATVEGHLSDGRILIRCPALESQLPNQRFVLRYSDYGIDWRKGWTPVDDLLAINLLDQSAR